MFPNLTYSNSDGGGRTISPTTNNEEYSLLSHFLDCLLPFTRFWGVFTSIGKFTITTNKYLKDKFC